MLPYASLIKLDHHRDTPLYLQMSGRLIQLMTEGKLVSGMRLPSSRQLAELLGVHRKTVIAAYEELLVQGWVVSRKGAGTFVNEALPVIQSDRLIQQGWGGVNLPPFTPPQYPNYSFNDGHPDVRLAPIRSLISEYGSLTKNRRFHKTLNYQFDFMGDSYLRYQLCKYLHESRGIVAEPEEVLLTRGSIMGFYLILAKYLQAGENVVVGDPSYQTFNELIQLHRGNLLKVRVDEYGMDVAHLEEICSRQYVRFVYVISHHHHPTTVKLIPERRLQLLELAEKYDFVIIEDDYDYDFHYEGSSVLPLASTNRKDRIIYAGSFSKTLVPSLRLGFLVLQKEWAYELSQLRRYIDRSGDPLLERSMGVLLESGEIRRSLNKANVAYKKRRDVLCDLLDKDLAKEISYKKPEGGMAVWVKFADHINVQEVIKFCANNDLYLSNPETYQSKQHTRLGFASMDEREINMAFQILKQGIRQAHLPS